MNNKNITISTAITIGTLASGSTSATIVYQDSGVSTSINGQILTLDVNSDGIDDLGFQSTYSSYYRSTNRDLWAYGLNGTQITSGGPLAFGDLIDSADSFTDANHMADYNYSYWTYSCGRRGRSTCYNSYHSEIGTWNSGFNTINGYLGFELNLLGTDTLYGWVDITMQYYGYATINSFAYENYPDTGILAGQKASPVSTTASAITNSVPEPTPLALLALGAVGIAMTRKKQALRN